MKMYKGFNKDMTCKGFQFEQDKTYHEDKAKLCECGFHACEYPLDCFKYYSPNKSVFHEVEMEDISDKKENDTKRCAKTIKIGARLDIAVMVEASVEYIKSKIKKDDCLDATNTGDCSAATNTGYYSAATNTGGCSVATNTGYQSAATNTGHYSAATNTGDRSAATNTGHYSAATNTGDQSAATNTGGCSVATNTGRYSAATNTGYYSVATNTGRYSAATNTGRYSAATNTGRYSAAEVSGRDSIALASGYNSKAKASLGSAICICERGEYDGDGYPLINVKAAIIDGEILKPDTYYTLKDGEFVEWEEE